MAKLIINILIYLCFMPWKAHATDVEIEYFIIKPNICVVEKHSSCESDFEFQWRISEEHYICIYHQQSVKPLYCNRSQKEEKIVLAVNIQSQSEFTLIVGEQHYKASITLQKLGVDLRKTRRHLWSVF